VFGLSKHIIQPVGTVENDLGHIDRDDKDIKKDKL
jgi:hypothetical protein